MDRKILICTVILSVFALAGQAAANVFVRDSVVVDGSQVRVKDVFAGTNSNALIGPAPAPGRRMVLDSYALERIAHQHSLHWVPTSDYVQSVVTRDSRILDAGEITEKLHRALVDAGMPKNRKVELTNGGLSIAVATNVTNPYRIKNAVYDARSDHASAILTVDPDGDNAVNYHLDAITYTVVNIPVLDRRIRRGETIGASDVIWKQVRKDTIGRNVITDRDGVIGQAARRYLSPNRPLLIDDVEAPKIVRKGSIVTIYYVLPHLELTAKARAVEDGAVNDTIRVVNINSNRTIEAVVRGPAKVVIPTGLVAVNGTREQ